MRYLPVRTQFCFWPFFRADRSIRPKSKKAAESAAFPLRCRLPANSNLAVNLRPRLDEFDGLGFHALLQRRCLVDALLRREFTHILRDLHRAEMRPAHRAEVGDLGRFLGQRFVVEFTRLVRVETEVELVVPAELKARLGQRVVTDLGAGVSLGQVGGMGGELVGDDAFLDVILVGQAEVLLGRHVAEHGRTVPADHRGADAAGDVVVARRDFGQFAQGLQFAELGFVIGVVDRAGTQAVAEAEGDVVGLHDFADFLEMRVEEAFLVVRQAPLGHDRAAAADDTGHPVGGHRHVAQQDVSVDGEVVDALFGLFDQRSAEDFPGQVFGLAIDLFQGLVDGHGADGNRTVADDPLAGFVDVLAGGQVHYRVAAPADRPGHLFNFFLDGGAEGGVADVGVDLGEEVATDDHRFAFRVVDVVGDDGAAAGDFATHEVGGDFSRDAGAEVLARVLAGEQAGHLVTGRYLQYQAK